MFDVYSSVNIIFINFDKYLKFDISYIFTLVWPPKRLRNQLVARGRKRLCTTGLSSRCQPGSLHVDVIRRLLPNNLNLLPLKIKHIKPKIFNFCELLGYLVKT